MNERTRKIIVFSTLPVALVWGYFNLTPSKQTKPVPENDKHDFETVAPLSKVLQPHVDTVTAIIEQIASKSWGVDPFTNRRIHRELTPQLAMPTATTKGDLSWVLSGIIFNEASPIAYINGRPVKIGDKINNARVVSIDRRAVTLDLNGRRFTISISKEARS